MLKISVEDYAGVLLDVAQDYNIKIGKKALVDMINDECAQGKISEIFVYKFLKALKAKAKENGQDMSNEKFEELEGKLIEIGNNVVIENSRNPLENNVVRGNQQNYVGNNRIPNYDEKRKEVHKKTYYPKNKEQQKIMQNSIKNRNRPHRSIKKKMKLALATVIGIAGITGAGMALSNNNANIKQAEKIQEIGKDEINIDDISNIINKGNENIQENDTTLENNIIKTNDIENLSYTDNMQDEKEENKLFNMIVEEYNQRYPEAPITVEDLGIVYSISSNRIYYENGKYILNYNLDRNAHPNAKIISAEIPTYIVLNNKTMSPISAVAKLSNEYGLKETNINVEQYILNYSDTGIYINDGKTVDLIMENPKNLEEIDKYNEEIYKLYEEQCKERQESLDNIEKQERIEKLQIQNDVKSAEEER